MKVGRHVFSCRSLLLSILPYLMMYSCCTRSRLTRYYCTRWYNYIPELLPLNDEGTRQTSGTYICTCMYICTQFMCNFYSFSNDTHTADSSSKYFPVTPGDKVQLLLNSKRVAIGTIRTANQLYGRHKFCSHFC